MTAPAPRERRLDGNLQHAGHLLGLGHQFAVMAALREEMFRVGFLKIAAADFSAGNLRGDSEDGDTVTMTVVEPVDQMEIPGAATARANGQASGEMRFRASGKRRRLLMSDVNPARVLAPANGIRDAVERVTCDAVHSLDSRSSESLQQQLGYVFLRHGSSFPRA